MALLVSVSLRKADLRRGARQALIEKGYGVTVQSGPGFLPGARLEAVRGKEVLDVSVRATQERFLGFSRHPNGHWRTLENMDLVLVATPLSKESNSVEVFAFGAPELIPLFTEAERQSKGRHSISSMPVFIPLDEETKKQVGHAITGLKNRALWRKIVELDRTLNDQATEMSAFLERVKRDFARLTGVKAEDVTVEFRIKS